MRRVLFLSLATIGAALLLVAEPKPPAMGNKTVVIELFTSQG